MGTVNDRIVPMDETENFEVAEGDPDVRGWQVIASDGVRVGEVDELLIDLDALRVRYLDVLLDGGEDGREESHVLIPVGHARLHERDDRILVDGVGSDALRALPRYAQEPLTHAFEKQVTAPFRLADLRDEGDSRPQDTSFDDDRLYGARRRRRT